MGNWKAITIVKKRNRPLNAWPNKAHGIGHADRARPLEIRMGGKIIPSVPAGQFSVKVRASCHGINSTSLSSHPSYIRDFSHLSWINMLERIGVSYV